MGQIININIRVLPTSSAMSIQIDYTQIIQELKDYLFDEFNLNFGQNGWTCYSQQRQCFLKPNQQIENYPNDTLIFDNDRSSESNSSQIIIRSYVDSQIVDLNKSQNAIQSPYSIIFENSKNLSIISSQEINFPIIDSIINIPQIDSMQLDLMKSENVNSENKKDDQTIYIIVHFLIHRLILELKQDVEIQEIFDALNNHYSQNDQNLNKNNKIHELVCHSQKRNCYLKFNEIVGNYPDDTLIFKNLQDLQESSDIQSDYIINKQLQSIQVKVDQRNIEVMEVNQYTQIKDLLSTIKNKYNIQENYDKWICHSEMRKCYLNMDQQFGQYPNDKLLITTEYQLQKDQFLQHIKQMKKEIKDKFQQTKDFFLKDLNRKKKEMTSFLKYQKEIIQTSSSSNEFILEKNQVNIKMQKNISQMEELTQKWRVDLNKIGLQKDFVVQLEIDKSTTGIELLYYLKEHFSNLQKKNKTEVDFNGYSLKYEKIIVLQNELFLEMKQDDQIIMGSFLVTYDKYDKNSLYLSVQSL